ncbi:bolA-like protein 3 [Octopus sinensis]|uniref:BolA-like protein 3 n=1 Tax=Octopus sinensis TaxID=2607531 RepID=A0A7E6F9W6_9MOLL|nr:bolA-like protein 3 [Octopus sinensis]
MLFRQFHSCNMFPRISQISRLFFSPTQILRTPHSIRYFCTKTYTDGEKIIINILKQKFPLASQIEVADISGGCGAMYEIFVESEDFQGKNMLTQHRMVNKALADEIKDMHGLRISTQVPDISES